MICTKDCPQEPHYHIGDSGPLCDGRYPHPQWCAVEHLRFDDFGNLIKAGPDSSGPVAVYEFMPEADN